MVRVSARSFSKYSPILRQRRVATPCLNLQRFYSSPPSFSPRELLQALEMMANSSESLPPIPPGQEFEIERFWQAYLLANQIIMYLAARPPTEAETFAAIFQSASVPEDSAIARGRTGVLKISKQIVDTMSAIPSESPLYYSHPEIFKAFKQLQRVYLEYKPETEENEFNLERWSKFFVGLRTELVEFVAQLGPIIEQWDSDPKK